MNTPTEIIQGQGFRAEVIRTNRRKTIAIKVEDSHVSVVAPRFTPKGKLEELVARKTPWIWEKRQFQRAHPLPRPKQYVSGENFPYLGRYYRLRVESGPILIAKLHQGRLLVQLPPSMAKPGPRIHAALVDWYRGRALQTLREKVERFTPIVGAIPTSVGVKTFKSRWGSCTSRGQVEFNWKLIGAPHHVIDYVVVHELCHLRHHNHSPAFWQCVEQVFPAYAQCKEWLRTQGRRLDI